MEVEPEPEPEPEKPKKSLSELSEEERTQTVIAKAKTEDDEYKKMGEANYYRSAGRPGVLVRVFHDLCSSVLAGCLLCCTAGRARRPLIVLSRFTVLPTPSTKR